MTDAQEPVPYPLKARTPLQPAAERARLRVARVTLPGGDEAALLTRYADARTALSAPRFSRDGLSSPDAAGDSEGVCAAAAELRAHEGPLTAPLPRLPVTR